MKGGKTLFGLCVLVALAFAAWNMALPLVPLLLVDLKASPKLLGAVVGAGALGSVFLALPGSRLVRRWGCPALMARAAALCAASALFLAFFPSVGGLVAGLFFLEIGRLLFTLGAQAQVATLGEGRDLNLDFGWFNTATAIGQLAGPLAAGIAMDTAGRAPTWLSIAALLAAAALLAPRLLPANLPAARLPGGGGSVPRRGWRRYLSASLLVAVIASFAVIFADGARTTFFPVLMKERGQSATVIGAFMSLRALVSMSTRLYMKPLIGAAGGRGPALAASIAVMAVGIGCTPWCGTYPLLALNAVLVGLGIGMALPLSMATVSEGVAPEDRGTAMGIRLTGNQLALVANPFFFGAIAQRGGLGLSFAAAGILLFACTIPIAAWHRKARKVR